jgi:hypothetical protein
MGNDTTNMHLLILHQPRGIRMCNFGFQKMRLQLFVDDLVSSISVFVISANTISMFVKSVLSYSGMSMNLYQNLE